MPILFSVGTSCSDAESYATNYPEKAKSVGVQTLLGLAAETCTLPVGDITPAEAEDALEDKRIAWDMRGDTLTLYARSEKTPIVCCSLHSPDWTSLSEDDLWATRLRMTNLQQSMLHFFMMGDEDETELSWRGPDAPAALPFTTNPDTPLAGTVLEETLDSPQLNETRKLSIYLPPDHDPNGNWPVLVLADGEEADYYGRLVEERTLSGEVRPFVVIGLHSGSDAIVHEKTFDFDVRAGDYLPEYRDAPERFDAHLEWVTETVLPWAREEFGVTTKTSETVVAGKSNGAVFALQAALLRPDVFRHAIVMSPGYMPLASTPDTGGKKARFLISAGTYEPSFYYSADAAVRTLEDAEYDVSFRPFYAGHYIDQWDVALHDALAETFPPGE
ncbi:MAG: alpha/beta hydrolase-fold protein [Henriciella sp.]